IVANIEYFPPNYNAIGKAYFSSHEFSVSNSYCEVGSVGRILYNSQSLFNIDDLIAYGPTCGDQDILNFTGKHFSIYSAMNLIPKNPFSYAITTNGSSKSLVITNPDGDQAFDGNTPLHVQGFDSYNLSIYPNPVKNKIHVSSQNDLGILGIQ